MILSYRAVDGSSALSMIFMIESLFFRRLCRRRLQPARRSEVRLLKAGTRRAPAKADAYWKYLSVKTKPRSFSGRDTRQGSSGAEAETFEIETCALLGSYFGLGSSGCWHVFKIA